MPEKSLALSLRTLYETLAISLPTVVDAARGRVTKERCDQRLENWARTIVERAALTLEVTGREHLRPNTAYLVMSNHQSNYDIPILFHVLGSNLRMIAKLELFRVPIFGDALREAGFIAVDRSNRERAIESLRDAKAKLASGVNVWIAPEGTRSVTGDLGPFKKGGFVLALDTGWPILPVSLRGTRDVLRPRHYRSSPGAHVHVVLHEPIDPARYAEMPRKSGREALMTDVRAAIASGL
jgi:1-acyl-sn-glycerol-3-phosphate acyltransferase